MWLFLLWFCVAHRAVVELGRAKWKLFRYTNRSMWHVEFFYKFEAGSQKPSRDKSTRDLFGTNTMKRTTRTNKQHGQGRTALESFQWDPPAGWGRVGHRRRRAKAKAKAKAKTKARASARAKARATADSNVTVVTAAAVGGQKKIPGQLVGERTVSHTHTETKTHAAHQHQHHHELQSVAIESSSQPVHSGDVADDAPPLAGQDVVQSPV